MDELPVHYSLSIYREHHLQHAFRKRNNELECIFHLTESHCPSFRHKSANLYMKAKMDKQHEMFPMMKENYSFHCLKNTQPNADVNELLQKLEEMPSEWTLIQITPGIEPTMTVRSKNKYPTNSLYLTVFNCGNQSLKPLLIFKAAPLDAVGNTMDILQQIHAVKDENNKGFQQKGDRFHRETYSDFKSRLSYNMKDCIRSVENHWLAHWRILLMGNFVNKDMEIKAEKCLDNILTTFNIHPTEKVKRILKYAVKGQMYLQLNEVKNLVKYCLPKLGKDEMIKLVKEIKNSPAEFAKEPRDPVILILDPHIDLVPWEMIDVLRNQPVSRMQSFHFTYGLFREHEADIVKGRKILSNPMNGKGIINPGLDLKRMELRLGAFYAYWVPSWDILSGQRPTSEQFMDYLMNCDIFCYCGHGDGFQFLHASHLQKIRVSAVVLLFGCSSVKLERLGPLCEPIGTSQTYITSCSPCVVGNLWNIGDHACDTLSTKFISYWVPSKAETHWTHVNLKEWDRGESLVKIVPAKGPTPKVECSGDLLYALIKAKNSGNDFLTQAACIARGIPVRIE